MAGDDDRTKRREGQDHHRSDGHLKPELEGQVQSLLQLLRELEWKHRGRLGGGGRHRDEEGEGPQEERNREPTQDPGNEGASRSGSAQANMKDAGRVGGGHAVLLCSFRIRK